MKPKCDNCHKELKPSTQAHRLFCSDTCRAEFWKKAAERGAEELRREASEAGGE